MGVTFQCEHCGTRYNLNRELAGKRAKCKTCRNVIVIPAASSGAATGPERFSDFPAVSENLRPPVSSPQHEAAENAVREQEKPKQIARQPSNSQRVKSGAILPTTQSSVAPVVLKQQLAQIKTLLDRGQYLESTVALREIEPQARNHPAYHYVAGMAYNGLGNYPHALEHFSQAIRLGASSPILYASKGKAELELRDFPSAIESLDMALDLAGTDVPDYMAYLARAYEGAAMVQDAGATWNALAQINPNHPALIERQREIAERRSRKQQGDVQNAMLQLQKEQRAADTACWICIILRILLECM